MPGQRIIDLDAVVPEDIVVKLTVEEDGRSVERKYPLPSDIPIPDFLRIARTLDSLTNLGADEAAEALEDAYELVLDLFRIKSPSLESLPIGPRRLLALIVQVYGEEDTPEPDRPTRRRNGTRSTSRSKPTRSRSGK